MNTRIRSSRRQLEGRIDLSKRRAWYGEEATADATATATQGQQQTTDDKGDKAKVKFTPEQQAYINEIAGKSRDEGRTTGSKEAITAYLKSLGFEKPEDVQAIIEADRKRKEGEKSELEKANERIAAAEKKALEAEEARLKVENERRIDNRDKKIVQALTAARGRDAEDVLILMERRKPELVASVMKEDGTIDEAKLKALVEAAKVDYRDKFVGSGPGSQSNNNGTNLRHDEAQREAATRTLKSQLKNRF